MLLTAAAPPFPQGNATDPLPLPCLITLDCTGPLSGSRHPHRPLRSSATFAILTICGLHPSCPPVSIPPSSAGELPGMWHGVAASPKPGNLATRGPGLHSDAPYASDSLGCLPDLGSCDYRQLARGRPGSFCPAARRFHPFVTLGRRHRLDGMRETAGRSITSGIPGPLSFA